MATRKNTASEGISDTKTEKKGESQHSKSKGASGVSDKKSAESKHQKDDSDGAKKSTSKK